VTDIVKQRCRANRASVFIGDPLRVGPGAQMLDGLPGEVEYPDRVLEAGMPRTRPDTRDETQLLDALQPQKCLRIDQRQFGVRQRDDIVQTVAQHGGHRKPGASRAPKARFWMCDRCLLQHGERIRVNTAALGRKPPMERELCRGQAA